MGQATPNDYDSRRSGMLLRSEELEALRGLLAGCLERLPARFVLLVDLTGQVVLALGDPGQADLGALGALVAGDLAASQEIARLTGEYQDYQVILREGQSTHLLIAGAGPRLSLLAQVGREVPLGWSRVLVRDVACRAAAILAGAPPAESPVPAAAEQALDLDPHDLASLVDGDLAALWTG